MSCAPANVAVGVDAALDNAANGMTAASAPTAGNQMIIQISSSFRKNFIRISRQA